MEILYATLSMYREAFARPARLALRNWLVLGTVFAYSAIVTVTASLAFRLGIAGGFLMGFVLAACIGSFLHLVGVIVRESRVSVDDFLGSFTVHLWDVIGVLFVLWILRLVLEPALHASPQGPALLLVVQLFLFVFFNAVPELIYLGRHSLFALLGESYRFVTENWIEWFPPNLLLAAGFYLLLELPAGGLAGIVRTAVLALFVYFAMVARGFLFLELSGRSRRARAFRWRAR